MPRSYFALSNSLSLDAVIARLAQRQVVDGVIIYGSACEGTFTPASDYDMVIMHSSLPVPIHSVLTYVDARLTDIVFVKTTVLERLLRRLPTSEQTYWPASEQTYWQRRLINWLQKGEIVFDRSGGLQQARSQVQNVQGFPPPTAKEIHSAWFNVYYSVKQLERHLKSNDPVYLMSVDLRLHFSLSLLWISYFQVRGLPWQGNKKAIRYLEKHDPAYLVLFKKFIAEINREEKVRLYKQLADLVLAPVGEVWVDGATSIEFRDGTKLKPKMIEKSLDFWENLITE